MMKRMSVLDQFDASVRNNGITLVCGLPRVGRTSLLADLQSRRTDTKHCQEVAGVPHEAGIFVLDDVGVASVDAIIAKVRQADKCGLQRHLVVAPNDLATMDCLQTALTGIVDVVEVPPLQINEVAAGMITQSSAEGPIIDTIAGASPPRNKERFDLDQHWLRGGLPQSLNAESDAQSFDWRCKMLESLLIRDYTRWDIQRTFQLRDVFIWLARRNGSELGATGYLDFKRQELISFVHVLERLGLVRRLFNTAPETKPKIFVRDTGILYALLGIETSIQLRSHSSIGSSFESYAMEALILAANGTCKANFYRKKGSRGEDEIDLVLDFPSQNDRLVAIEFKVGSARKEENGFHNGCADLKVAKQDQFVVHSGEKPVFGTGVPRLDLKTAIKRIAEIARVSS
ncbi:DUF4143 domain-containing protein [Pseudovibrio sp. Tun.PSC04-5.I4]|uniref:DUF4143 domain-containing protein n=1 Tax=Pseudovibrio sp. Tun.PSC04-5.I4 TaxID=1798213 RepID=UPI00088905F1|nr:DUF4143 domain-containing protein [Pseudovibrio sp. Tun.PSC04-5.I4]SDR49262.1 protein of unknown function [Pseudovibrio sp. Tun.PSC04-5.I4]